MKKIFIFLLCFFNILNVFAWVENKAEITKISYLDYFSENKIITITGKHLDKCNDLSFKWFTLNVIDKSATVITFKFNELTTYWKIDLLCDWWEKISKDFGIPYISRVSLKNDYSDGKIITISGKNFWENPIVKMDGWSFNVITSDKKTISWKITWNILSNDIYITSDWFKSNLYYSKLEIPRINYIKSESNFLYETDIFLYWDYLIKWNDLELFINDKKYLNFKYDKNQKYIKLKLWNKLWKHKIYIKYKGLISNTITIDVTWNKVFLEKITEKISDNDEQRNKFIIKWTNFPKNQVDISLYLNWVKISIDRLSKNEIEFSQFNLKLGKNKFYVIVNWEQSNNLYKYNEYDLPSVSWISSYEIKDGNKIFSLSLNNYIRDEDNIYFNNWIIKPLSCYWNTCRFTLSQNILKWSFTAWRENKINKDIVKFNHTDNNKPFIEKIVFSNEIKPLTKFKIYGNSLDNITLTASNLFSNTDSILDYKNNWSTISWRLPRNYNMKLWSAITISKNWQKSTLWFKFDEVKWKTIYAAPYIKSLYNKRDFIQVWDEVTLHWKWFRKWDKLILWKNEVILNNTQNTYWNAKFKLTDDIKSWLHKLYIINAFNKKSNTIEIYILDSNNKQIEFTQKNLKDLTFDINKKYTNIIYKTEIKNNIKDIEIQNISFKVIDNKKEDYLWNFSLFINNKIISDTNVDSKWNITFSERFILPQSDKLQTLTLRKNGFFHNNWKFKIILDKSKFKLKYNSDEKYINDITFFNTNGQNIIVNKKNNFDCYDEKSKLVYCNELLNIKVDWKIISNESENTDNETLNKQEIAEEIKENTKKIPNKVIEKDEEITTFTKSQQDLKLDKFLNKIYNKQWQKSTKSQLSYYKNLKYKLWLINKKLPEGKNKQLVTYINDWITIKYKKVFKQFILEKKNKK